MNGDKSARIRKGFRIALAVLVVPATLLYLMFGGYLLICWIRIHSSHVYYADFPYLSVGFACLGIGSACLGVTLFAVRRRSFYGLLFIIPGVLGFYGMVSFVDVRPNMFSITNDTNYLSDIGAYLRVWYEAHHAFPADDSEFAQAMAEGPAPWQGYSSPHPESKYKQQGRALPYQVLVIPNATGPRSEHLSDRPGVIYYCVSADLQEFWVTMTGLDTGVAPSATIKRVADDLEVWLIHAAGSDYPRDEKALREYQDNPGDRLPLAETLNHLGIMYGKAWRKKEAEDAFTKALQVYRELAKTNPSWYAYTSGIASTLNNLGDLYSDTSRPKEAAEAYTEALQLRRELTKKNRSWYGPGLASTLNSMGSLYARTKRFDEAASSYAEALQIRRELAKANPIAYLPDLAATLNNLGTLYKSEGRSAEAAQDCEEAATIFRQLSIGNPGRYSPRLSTVCSATLERPS
jgi:tetratricopeptide (TPR) repeat protein